MTTQVGPPPSFPSSGPWQLPGEAAGIRVLILLAFFLPFASVSWSCEGRTLTSQRLTGWKLVTGEEVVITDSGTGPLEVSDISVTQTVDAITDAKQDIKERIGSLQAAALDSLIVTVVTLTLAAVHLALVARPELALTLPFAAAVLIGGALGALSFLSLLVAGDGAGTTDAHYYGGFWLAALLAVTGLVIDYLVLREAARRWPARRWRMSGAAGGP